MKKTYPLICMLLLALFTQAQNPKIDHWEVAIDVEGSLNFIYGTEAPPIDWNSLAFDDKDWEIFDLNGVGYGGVMGEAPDVLSVTSIYTRTILDIVDVDAIESLALNYYYEDGYVAYINGVEVARVNMGEAGSITTYNQTADSTHINHADLNYGHFPPGQLVKKEVLATCLQNGKNILAIELHNDAEIKEVHNYFGWVIVALNIEDDQYLYRDSYLPVPIDVDEAALDLPLLKIYTHNAEVILNDPKINAHMELSYSNASGVGMVSSTIEYAGNIGIELRGSSSLNNYPKKSYTIETRDSLANDLNVSLLGMPKESDWVLYAPYGDKTMLRNALTYQLSNDIGKYAPRSRFVEVKVNDNFLGTYILMEKIKRDKNRVDISKLREDELAGDSLTGGYIISIDKKEGNFDGWSGEYGSAERESGRTFFQYVYPKYDNIKEEQKLYIQNFMNEFESSLRKDDFDDAEEGYRKYMNPDSFIDYLIVNELGKNMDSYRLSTFMYKDRDDKDGRLNMGPPWDYNLAYGNYEYANGYETSGWAFDFGKVISGDSYFVPFWWDRLLQDENFVNQLETRWKELREKELHQDAIFNRIDSLVDLTTNAQQRNYAVWTEVFASPIWPNAEPLADSYNGEVTYLKNWISDRLDWLDVNMGEVRDKKVYVSIQDRGFSEYLSINAYPNPFDVDVNVSIELESAHHVKLVIYNQMGQEVAVLSNEYLLQGQHQFTWNGEQNDRTLAPNGMYLYSIFIDQVPQYKGKIMKQ